MKKVKMFSGIMLMMAMCMCLTGCYKVEPGYVGLKIKMTGNGKGNISVVDGGYSIATPTVMFEKYPTFTENYTYTADRTEGSESDESFTFQSSEGMKVSADLGISYYFDVDSVEELYRTYRKGPSEIRSTVVRNCVRDSLNKVGSKYHVENIIGSQKEQLIKDVYLDVKEKLSKHGIVVQTLSWVHPPTPPQSVINALNLKVEATQNAMRVENELRQTEAQAKKNKIEIDTRNYEITAQAEAEAESALVRAEAEARGVEVMSKAEAKANELLAKSVTPELIEYQKIIKWDGANPRVAGQASVLITDKSIR